MGLGLMSRDRRWRRRRKGLQPCSLVIGARDDSLAGDPCYRSVRVRGCGAIPRPGPEGKITDPELIALGVAQAAMGVPSDRQFLGLVGKVLPGWFPNLPEQSQYNRRLRRLAPTIASVQLRVAELIASSDLRIADGTLLGVANYPGCGSRSAFAGTAAYGYCPSKSQFLWGMRLVLITDATGVPVGYTLVAANEKEYEPVRELLPPTPAARCWPTKASGDASTPRRSPCRTSPSSPPTADDTPKPPPRETPRQPATRDRVDHRQPQMPDAARPPPRQNTRRTRPTHRPAAARTDDRHAPQHPHRPPTPRARRL